MTNWKVYADVDGECIMQIRHDALTEAEVKTIAEMIFGELVFVKKEES